MIEKKQVVWLLSLCPGHHVVSAFNPLRIPLLAKMNLTKLKILAGIRRWLPLLLSVASLLFAGLALRHQSRESELQLWNSLRREFDHEMKKERRACGEAFSQGKLGDQYSSVMNFFDTVGFLVRTKRVDGDLFDDTWGYYFSGYFQATKDIMLKDRANDPRSYDGVFYLARRFSADPALKTPADIKAFFEDERRLPD